MTTPLPEPGEDPGAVPDESPDGDDGPKAPELPDPAFPEVLPAEGVLNTDSTDADDAD
jgi:hypothetical protein